MFRINALVIGLMAIAMGSCSSDGSSDQHGQAAADLARRYHVEKACVTKVFDGQDNETQTQLAKIGAEGINPDEWQTQKTLDALGEVMACPPE